MGFIIVIIISMLLFDLCECVLWKFIHTFCSPRTLLEPREDGKKVVICWLSVADIASKMHELSLYSFVYYMGIHTAFIWL